MSVTDRVAALRHPVGQLHDRATPPADTVRRLRPHFVALGITRVARQTGLDRIGIPCFAAFRPNALTLANNQGKGVDDDAAMASAVMEAAEFATAERGPMIATRIESRRLPGAQLLVPSRQLPIGETLPDDLLLPLCWGTDLLADRHVFVVADAVSLDMRGWLLPTLARSTNGLASGNDEDEAVLHGLLELIERDGTTIAGLLRPRPIDPSSLADAAVDRLVEKIRAAECDLWLFDQTTDIGIPVIKAVIGESRSGFWHFDLAAGYGAHLVPGRAAVRAITEAAQTRVTNIAGSRDDFLPGEYRRHEDPSRRSALGAPFIGAPWEDAAGAVPRAGSTSTVLSLILERMARAGITRAIKVVLPADPFGISVVKVFAPDLEDRSCNRNWRPGPRSLGALLSTAA